MFWHFLYQIRIFSVPFCSVLIHLEILYCIYIVMLMSESYSEPYQTSKIELFAKIVNGLKPLFLQKPPS